VDQNQLNALIRQLNSRIQLLESKASELAAKAARPMTLQEQIDAIPGRRIGFSQVATQTFTTTQDGTRAAAMNFTISQDGPFILTHYPMAMWKPSNAGATNFGEWRPVCSAQLPTQTVATDFIDISYELVDGGSNRQLYNLPVPGGLLSTPNNMILFPVPTMFMPNTTIQFIPTYENIAFNGGGTPTSSGTLVVMLPGYKIVNL
jgi:hypothetical protein